MEQKKDAKFTKTQPKDIHSNSEISQKRKYGNMKSFNHLHKWLIKTTDIF